MEVALRKVRLAFDGLVEVRNCAVNVVLGHLRRTALDVITWRLRAGRGGQRQQQAQE